MGEKGLLLADKTGEIGFINNKNINQIANLEEVKEDVKYEDNNYYKTLYGHGEMCLGLEFTADRQHLVSWDTLNKVLVVPWPNVFAHRT